MKFSARIAPSVGQCATMGLARRSWARIRVLGMTERRRPARGESSRARPAREVDATTAFALWPRP
jgi:hypothetical protein